MQATGKPRLRTDHNILHTYMTPHIHMHAQRERVEIEKTRCRARIHNGHSATSHRRERQYLKCALGRVLPPQRRDEHAPLVPYLRAGGSSKQSNDGARAHVELLWHSRHVAPRRCTICSPHGRQSFMPWRAPPNQIDSSTRPGQCRWCGRCRTLCLHSTAPSSPCPGPAR